MGYALPKIPTNPRCMDHPDKPVISLIFFNTFIRFTIIKY